MVHFSSASLDTDTDDSTCREARLGSGFWPRWIGHRGIGRVGWRIGAYAVEVAEEDTQVDLPNCLIPSILNECGRLREADERDVWHLMRLSRATQRVGSQHFPAELLHSYSTK